MNTKKTINTLLGAFLTLALLLPATSCGIGNASKSPSGSSLDINGYSIVRPDSCTAGLKSSVVSFRKRLEDLTGVKYELKTDYADYNGKEILIGKTSRPESEEALSLIDTDDGRHAYIVKISDDRNKIIINGNDDVAIALAMKYFLDEYGSGARGSVLDTSSGSLYTAADDTESVLISDLTVVTYESTVKITGPSLSNRNAELTYGRILMLEHNGEYNGTLFATAEGLESENYKIYESTDNGGTWKQVSTVSSANGVANWQPMIYELPCDTCGMKEGTLLLAGCLRNSSTNMVIWRSTDRGRSWYQFTTVQTSSGKTGGVWEPFLICDDTGDLFCFYSTETDSTHSQKLVYRKTKNGRIWGDETDVVAPKNVNYRPGMITIARMGNGKYIATYEMVGLDGTNYCKITDDLSDWGAADDYGAQIKTTDGHVGSGTPYCTWTSAGGDKGTVIMSGKFEASGRCCGLYLSKNYGESWIYLENPMPYTNTEGTSKHRFGYSPGFFTASDGTVYYVNCVDTEETGISERADLKLTVIKLK